VEVVKHFPTSMGVDDFMARLEMALAAYGFTGDNAIGECVHRNDQGTYHSMQAAIVRQQPLTVSVAVKQCRYFSYWLYALGQSIRP
jgi:hypothetical protein